MPPPTNEGLLWGTLNWFFQKYQWQRLAMHLGTAWLLPDVTPDRALRLLEGQEDGTFVVHWSPEPNCFGITVAHDSWDSDVTMHAATIWRGTIEHTRRGGWTRWGMVLLSQRSVAVALRSCFAFCR